MWPLYTPLPLALTTDSRHPLPHQHLPHVPRPQRSALVQSSFLSPSLGPVAYPHGAPVLPPAHYSPPPLSVLLAPPETPPLNPLLPTIPHLPPSSWEYGPAYGIRPRSGPGRAGRGRHSGRRRSWDVEGGAAVDNWELVSGRVLERPLAEDLA